MDYVKAAKIIKKYVPSSKTYGAWGYHYTDDLPSDFVAAARAMWDRDDGFKTYLINLMWEKK